jgi:hypothetical protein
VQRQFIFLARIVRSPYAAEIDTQIDDRVGA